MVYYEFSFIQEEVFHPHYLYFLLSILFFVNCSKKWRQRVILNLEYSTYALSADVTVRIQKIQLAQVGAPTIAFDVFPHLAHIMLIGNCAKGNPTLEADSTVAALHQHRVWRHVTADQALRLLRRLNWFLTALTVLIHPWLFCDFSKRTVQNLCWLRS
jgi:hypothetical protein